MTERTTMRADGDLLRRVRGRLAAEGGGTRELSAAHLAAILRDEARFGVDPDDVEATLDAASSVHAELAGAGPLEPLLADPRVTDVLVNGPYAVYADRGDGLVPVGIRFRDEADVRRLAVRLAAAAGRRLDESSPWVDVRLPERPRVLRSVPGAGSAEGAAAPVASVPVERRVRLHAVLPPVAAGGTHLSLRILRPQDRGLGWLVESGGLPPEAADLLAALVAARRSFVITGGTGSGKTTMLAAMLALVPHRERVVLVEDTGELLPRHPHIVRLEGRPPNIEGTGEVVLRDLVRQALRMRPDRIVVGEVRGGEVVELLAALNTGHEGSCGTLHARSPEAVPARVEALATAAGLDRVAAHSQLLAGLDVVVHLERSRSIRRLAALGVLDRAPDGTCQVSIAWTPEGRGPAWTSLTRLLAEPHQAES